MRPRSTADSYEIHSNNIEQTVQQYAYYDVYIATDYNLPRVTWYNDTSGHTASGYAVKGEILIETLMIISQRNEIKNKNYVLLDLIFTNHPCVYMRIFYFKSTDFIDFVKIYLRLTGTSSLQKLMLPLTLQICTPYIQQYVSKMKFKSKHLFPLWFDN